MSDRRHKRDHGAAGVNLAVIITPFLDVAFQLLSFFIMTYHPSALEGHIPGSLVPPETMSKKGPDNVADPLEPLPSITEDALLPELNEAILVKIKAVPRGSEIGNRKDGMPSEILIKQPADATLQVVVDSNVTFEADKADTPARLLLENRLKEIAAQPGVEKSNIKLEADGDLKQQYVMLVYDICKKAGFGKVNFVPPPLLREK